MSVFSLLRSTAFRIRYPDDHRFLVGLCDREKGNAGFVIGNGPSLRTSDLATLNELSGVTTIASNGIYLSYSETDWRADYYSIADPLVWRKCQNDFKAYHDVVLTPKYLESKRDVDCSMYYRHLGVVPTSEEQRGDQSYFSADASAGLFCGGTVTYENLQMAVYLGLDPIYIIGCDHNYSGVGQSATENVSKEIIHQGDVNNHFSKDYRAPGEKVLSANVIQMNAAFSEARRFSDASGIRIVNGTRGGRLEAFERADLDDVFDSLR
jgi:hypothetical protein